MRLIVLCAGAARRWNSFLGVDKHMVSVLGEPLICRTFRLFRQYQPDIECFVVLGAGAQPLNLVGVTEFYIPRNKLHESYKLTSSAALWRGEVISVFGDVFFTECAAQRIAAMPVEDFEWFGRMRGNRYTGAKNGEIFGVKFPATQGNRLIRAANLVRKAWRRGRALQTKAWELYRFLNGMPLIRRGWVKGQPAIKPPPTWAVGLHFTEIDDLTDDFDKPDDYRGWAAAVAQNAILAEGTPW